MFIAAALLLDQFVFQGERFWDVTPHPFWILVVLISAQYGTNEGLVATLAACAALLAWNLPVQHIDQDLYAYIFEISWRPMMWLVTAVVVGEISGRHLRERKRLLGEMQKATKGEERIAQAFTSTRIAKERLEAQVAGQLRTVLSTFRAAKAVEKLKPGEVLLGTLDLVEQALGPKKFSLYLLNNNVLEAAVQQGWESGDPFSTAIPGTSPLFQAVVGGRRFLCAADPEDETLLRDEGLLAGPLTDTDSGDVVGMLKLEDLDYYHINLATVENFKAVADWVGTALAHARQFEDVASLSHMAPGSNLFSKSYFERHASFLTALARQVGFPVSLITLRLENPEELDTQDLRGVPDRVFLAATGCIRETDACFEHGGGAYDYAIVLAGTDRENAQIVVDKLQSALDGEFARTTTEARITISLSELVPGLTGHAQAGATLPVPNRQITFLTRLARRFQFNLSLVSLRLGGVEKLETDRRKNAGAVVDSSLEAELDSIPLAFYYPDSATTYAVLLPALPATEVQSIADRLVGAANQALVAAGFEAEILAEANVLTRESHNGFEQREALAPAQAS